MTALESLREEWAELVAPEPNRLVARFDPPFGEQILDVAVAEVEAAADQTAYRMMAGGKRCRL
jgi:hypothetical protein